MKSKDIEKFFDENRGKMNASRTDRIRKLKVASLIIFPINIISFILCIVMLNSLTLALFVASVMGVVGYCYFIVGYNAAQDDNIECISTFIDKWSEFKKSAKKKKEDK